MRSQISLFVVLIGFIFIFVLYFTFTSTDVGESQEVKNFDNEFHQIKEYVQTCLDRTANEGLYFVAQQGGYHDYVENGVRLYYLEVPYYYRLGEAIIPSMKTLESEYEHYIDKVLYECLDNFTYYRNEGYEIEMTLLEEEFIVEPDYFIINSNLQGDLVEVSAKVPIVVSKDGSRTSYSEFSSQLDFNFKKKYDDVNQFILVQRDNGNAIPMSYLNELSYANNFTFEQVPVGNSTVLFSFIYDEGSSQNYIFTFAMEYDWSGVSTTYLEYLARGDEE